MAKEKNKKLFGKMLNFIGLEESEEEEYMDDYGDDGYDDGPVAYDDDLDDGYDDEEEPAIFSRGGSGRSARKSAAPERESRSARAPRESKRQPELTTPLVNESRASNVIGLSSAASGGGNKMRMIVYQPMTYDDTQNIIDNLKNKKPVIVNLESLETDVAQRILDFMSGAVYALDGNIHKISKGIFILAPANVDISGNVPDELQGRNFYSLNTKQRREY